MAEVLNWVRNDSQRAAEIYAGLIGGANTNDEKMWDFVEMRKHHEQIVGDVERKLQETGSRPADFAANTGRRSTAEIKRQEAFRLYEDVEALQSLRALEQAELEDCEKLMAMGDNRLSHSFVANSVIPVLREHIGTLDAYLQRISH